jgi:hypothetical protein
MNATERDHLAMVPEPKNDFERFARHLPGCPQHQAAYYRMRSEYRPAGYVEHPCDCGFSEAIARQAGGVS